MEKQTTARDVNILLRTAAAGDLRNILQVEDKPLVSMDFVNNPHSCIVDGPSTLVVDGNLVKVWHTSPRSAAA